MIKIGLNGFGRIGRAIFMELLEQKGRLYELDVLQHHGNNS